MSLQSPYRTQAERPVEPEVMHRVLWRQSNDVECVCGTCRLMSFFLLFAFAIVYVWRHR